MYVYIPTLIIIHIYTWGIYTRECLILVSITQTHSLGFTHERRLRVGRMQARSIYYVRGPRAGNHCYCHRQIHQLCLFGKVIDSRSNLYLVLCVSPISEAFRMRVHMFPNLVNCCTIGCMRSAAWRAGGDVDLVPAQQPRVR